MKNVARMVLALLLVGGVSAAVPSAAEASPLCSVASVCGQITNSSASERSILITCNWPYTASPWIHVLYPGEKSTKWCKDADGYFIPDGAQQVIWTGGYLVYLDGPLWRKVGDGARYTVYVIT